MARPRQPDPDARTEIEFERVHADALRFFPRLVEDLGGDANALLAQAGIDASIVAARGSSLGFRALAALLERAARSLQCPDFGMRLARLQGGGRVFGPMGVVMRNSSTLGGALEYVVGHAHAYSLAARMRFEPDRGGRGRLVAFEVLLDRLPDMRQAIEQALLLAHLNAMEVTGGRARVREVQFRHRPISPLASYRDFFGCELRFEQETDGVVFWRPDLDCPIVDPDVELCEMARSVIDTRFTRVDPPLHALVRGRMRRELGRGSCSNERIAAELGLHPRTLHRRLQAEGKSFQRIKDEVRRDLALYHLQHTDLPLLRIADKLGYSESAVFSRSCLRWFGISPSQLRSGAARVAGAVEAAAGARAATRRVAPRSRARRERESAAAPVPQGTAVVRAEVLRGFAELVTGLGGDAQALFARAQIDSSLAANRDAVVPFRAFAQLLERAAGELRCPDLGLRLAGAQRGMRVLGPLEIAMRHSATLGDAFRYCAEHFRAFCTGMRLMIQEERAHRRVVLRLETLGPERPRPVQALEHALLLAQQVALDLSGGRVRAREARLAHAPLSPLENYRVRLGTGVRFGQRTDGLVFDSRDWALAIPERDPQLFDLVRDFIEQRFPDRQPGLAARVRAVVERALVAGTCSHVAIARMLGMQPRTLQRRLRAEGACFETIKDEVRRELALRYLRQPDLPLIRVAERLGYASTSVLSRSCQRWYRASPRALRSGRPDA